MSIADLKKELAARQEALRAVALTAEEAEEAQLRAQLRATEEEYARASDARRVLVSDQLLAQLRAEHPKVDFDAIIGTFGVIIVRDPGGPAVEVYRKAAHNGVESASGIPIVSREAMQAYADTMVVAVVRDGQPPECPADAISKQLLWTKYPTLCRQIIELGEKIAAGRMQRRSEK